MIDRAVQAVYHMAIDPIVEEQSDPNSYGFRVHRSTHDAVTRLRTLLDKKTSSTWILDADVAKCFDKISHEFLLDKTVMCDKGILEQWLKCGVNNIK
jgi:RNA-directed DNA polymerase